MRAVAKQTSMARCGRIVMETCNVKHCFSLHSVYIVRKNMTRRTIETKLRSFLLQINVKFMIL